MLAAVIKTHFFLFSFCLRGGRFRLFLSLSLSSFFFFLSCQRPELAFIAVVVWLWKAAITKKCPFPKLTEKTGDWIERNWEWVLKGAAREYGAFWILTCLKPLHSMIAIDWSCLRKLVPHWNPPLTTYVAHFNDEWCSPLLDWRTSLSCLLGECAEERIPDEKRSSWF